MAVSGLSELVAQAYEAACDASGMAGFIENTADYFGAQQGAITITPNDAPENLLPIAHGISTDEIRGLCADRERSGTVFAALQQTRVGGTVAFDDGAGTGPMLISHSLQKTPSPPREMNILAGVVVADEHNRCELMLFREPRHGEYSPSEHEALQSLMRYLRRAIELNTRFVKMFVEHRTALSVLDNAPRSIIMLSQLGQANYQNRAATELLANNDGITLADGVFRVQDQAARDKIDSFLELARSSDAPEIETQQLMIVVPRSSGDTPYKLVIYKLPFDRQQAKLDDSQPLAVAMIYDPSMMNQLNESVLHHFYNLTHAESALAQAMYDGMGLPEAATELGISVNTTRTQLRSIFKKVGVHSQASLLRELTKNFFHA